VVGVNPVCRCSPGSAARSSRLRGVDHEDLGWDACSAGCCQLARDYRSLSANRGSAGRHRGDWHRDRHMAPGPRRTRNGATEPKRIHLPHSRLDAQTSMRGDKVSGYHHVRPYMRRDGTWVRGHNRRNPSPRAGSGVGVYFIAALVIMGCLASGVALHAPSRHGVPARSHALMSVPSPRATGTLRNKHL
jgi:hypothetical protein